MIVPTIARMLWYYPIPEENFLARMGTQPLPVTVCAVIDDRHVNVAGFDALGQPFSRQNVTLLQDDDQPPENDQYAEWMPFQKTQAQSTPAPVVETKTYPDGTQATGTAPLPDGSPADTAAAVTDANAAGQPGNTQATT